jgi:hypothetical protein
MDMLTSWPILPLGLGWGQEASETILWKAGLEWQARTTFVADAAKDRELNLPPVPMDDPNQNSR